MKKIKVLVFDTDPAEKSGANLREVLASNAGLLEVKNIAEHQPVKASKRLPSVLSSFSPHLGFLICGSLDKPAVADLFRVWRTGKPPRPLIAVVNSGDPKDVAASLFHGANDFLIPPFRAVDVLPRVWRWVAEIQEEDHSIDKLKEALGLRQFVGEDQKLVLYEWPGNVRELEHAIQRTLVLSEHALIEPGEIDLAHSPVASGNDSFQALKAIAVADFERKHVTRLLSSNEGNVSKVALASKKDRRSIQRLIEKHGISTEAFSPKPSAKGRSAPGKHSRSY